MEITKMLTISTMHVTEETYGKLAAEADGLFISNLNLPVYRKDDYGFFICAFDAEFNDNLPDDLRTCLNYALKHDCSWLCLDCDGEIMADLQKYEWE